MEDQEKLQNIQAERDDTVKKLEDEIKENDRLNKIEVENRKIKDA